MVWGKLVFTSWLVVMPDLRCIGSYVPISNVCGEWTTGSQTSLTSLKFLPVYSFPVGILFPEQCLHHDLPVLVTSWPWRRPVLHQDGSKRASDRFPGVLGRNTTRRTDRCDLRYGLDQIESIFITGNFVKRLLTYLGKFGADCRSWNVTFHNYGKLKTTGLPTWRTWES